MSRFFFLGLGLCLSACSLIELPVEVEPAPQKLAVSSVMVGRTGIIVSVSKSFSPLSGRNTNAFSDSLIESLLVRQARITLRYGTTTDSLRSNPDIPGFFAALTPGIQNGDSISVSINDPVSGLTAYASTRLMPPGTIDSAYYVNRSVFNQVLPVLVSTFPDPDGPNWYAMHVYNAREAFNGSGENVFLSGSDAVVFSTQFSDAGARNGRIRREFEFDFSYRATPADTLIIVLSNIEEGYFRFLDARRRVGGLVSSFLAEPLNYPDNVANGYGYFSAHQPRALILYPAAGNQPARAEPIDFLFFDRLFSRKTRTGTNKSATDPPPPSLTG